MNASTIIPVNDTYQIEVLNGTFYPILKSTDGLRFCYFRKGRNGQESRKTVKGAGDFIRAYMTRMGETPVSVQPRIDELAEETAACNMQWKRLLATPSYCERDLSNAPMFVEASDEYRAIETGVAEGDFTL